MGATKLSPSDWDKIIHTAEISFGETTVQIRPAGLIEMSLLIEDANAVLATAAAKGITVGNIGERAFELFQIVMTHAPAILEALSGVHRDDIARLPIAKSVELLKAIVEVNLDSPKALAENINALLQLTGKIDTQALFNVAGITHE